jgi:hypothetical protein
VLILGQDVGRDRQIKDLQERSSDQENTIIDLKERNEYLVGRLRAHARNTFDMDRRLRGLELLFAQVLRLSSPSPRS